MVKLIKYTKPLLRKGLFYASNCPFSSLCVYIYSRYIIDMANKTGIKYGGRQKGTANKATARLREAFTELLEGNMGR